jgi:hypothetical protein
MIEILLIISIVISSALAGLSSAVLIGLAMHRKLFLESIQECDKIKKEFVQTVAQAADINNNLVKQVANMQDQLLAHEMILKGGKR